MIGTGQRGRSAGQGVRGRVRAWAALLAILAVIFNGFAPGFHRFAMAHAAAADAIELCTSDGPVAVVEPSADRHDGSPARFAAGDCCGLCILGGAAFVAPSAIAPPPPGAVVRAETSAGTTVSVCRAPTGPPLPARGPPLFS